MATPVTLGYILGGALVLYVLFTIWFPISRRVVARSRLRDTRTWKAFSEDDVSRIEKYLINKQGRTRDLALLHTLYETGLHPSQIGRVKLVGNLARSRLKLAIDNRLLLLSPCATQYVLQWIGSKNYNPGDVIFTRQKSGKPMPRLQVEGLVRKWKAQIASRTPTTNFAAPKSAVLNPSHFAIEWPTR